MAPARSPRSLINCLFLLLIFAQGCASLGGGAPEAHIRLRTAVDLNPDASGRPSPVVLKIFNLKERAAFENARFIEIWNNAESILGGDLISVQEIELFPNHSHEMKLEAATANSRYIGIAAGFRNLDQAVWRDTIQLPESGRIYVNADVTSLSVQLKKGKRRDHFLPPAR